MNEPAPAPSLLDAWARMLQAHGPLDDLDPRIEALVTDLIGRVADKWTMILLDVLAEHGELRFTQIGRLAGGISQKMLTQTLRQMERDGLVTRTIHPVVPPRVDYRLTDLGLSLGVAFCGVWIWAAIQSSMVYLLVSTKSHRLLQPWCPQCRGDGGGGRHDAEAPDPIPQGSHGG